MNDDTLNIELLRRLNCEQSGIKYRRKMNLKYANDNLHLSVDALHVCGLKYVIYFGTLLGIVRENSLIKYDTDTDIVIFDFNKKNLEKFKETIREKGFQIFRDDKYHISVIKNGEYIDFYKFILHGDKYRCGKHEIDKKFFIKRSAHKFDDMDLFVPFEVEKCLEMLYGVNWKTPMRQFHAPGSKQLQNRLDKRKWVRLHNIAWFLVDILGIKEKVIKKYKKFKGWRD